MLGACGCDSSYIPAKSPSSTLPSSPASLRSLADRFAVAPLIQPYRKKRCYCARRSIWRRPQVLSSTSCIGEAGRYSLALVRSTLRYSRTHRAIIDYVRFSIGEALIDTIDDMINEGRIEPQLALKILLNYDRCISEALSEKVKSRLTFKVRLDDSLDQTVYSCFSTGPPGNLPILRRCLDLLSQRRQVQERCWHRVYDRESQDC